MSAERPAAFERAGEVVAYTMSAATGRRYVTPYHTGTVHLLAFEGDKLLGACCGREWPRTDSGISESRPIGPLCGQCQRAVHRAI